MGLEKIEQLEDLGKFTLRAGKGKGKHVLELAVSPEGSMDALGDVSKYLSSQSGVKVQAINYDEKSGKVVVNYIDVKKGASNNRGSTGCGPSMIAPYTGR